MLVEEMEEQIILHLKKIKDNTYYLAELKEQSKITNVLWGAFLLCYVQHIQTFLFR